MHGGEITLGNYDEFIRHSITKMSKLHLVSTAEYRKRVIQLGENPNSVHNIGSLGAENSLTLPLLSYENLLDRFQLENREYFVVLFHPETLTENSIENQMVNLLEAIDIYKKNYNFIFIGSNSDTGSNIIYNMLNDYTNKNNFKFLTSVKSEEYLSLVKYSKGLIGNSSSGLIEVPSLNVPTINIGDRQKGRVRGKSVIDVRANKGEIDKAIKTILAKEYRSKLKDMRNPYYQENSLEKAYQIIKEFLNSQNIKKLKEFYDL